MTTQAGDPAWLVTGYAEVRDLLSDRRLGRSHPCPERAARLSGSIRLGGPAGGHASERADHAAMRRLLNPAFSARRTAALRGFVRHTAEEVLDGLAAHGPPADLRVCFSRPLAGRVICELLGVPYADRDDFAAWADEASLLSEPERSWAAWGRLVAYVEELLRGKRRRPARDLLSDLAVAESPFSVAELARLGAAVLFGGYATTALRVDFVTAFLLACPDQRALVQRSPDLVGAAVEEGLRLASANTHGIPRYAHADLRIGGVTIREGDAILLNVPAANRDPGVFPDAGRFVVTRSSPAAHLAFGRGPRHCVGAGLARVELAEAVSAILRRLPGLRLAVPVAELRQVAGTTTEDFEQLPVMWDEHRCPS
ncbi:cytochrome P450 [Nonomuraea spiralis]|uniref:Cytochrome P450 n=1 Tax=Nonomuraea spiralis TaxID=46182 RepID=A0ABV5IRU2_9ACTN|nr:cytochrome P450 [Nonomuraea spiralis]